MLAGFEDATESTWGLPNVGPKRRSRFTSALTSICSASVKPSHQVRKSSVNSTSHSSKGIYPQRPCASMVVGVSQIPYICEKHKGRGPRLGGLSCAVAVFFTLHLEGPPLFLGH